MTLGQSDDRSCFTVQIVDDRIALEEDEQFQLLLQDPMTDGLLIGRDITTVTILDDDGG